MIWTKSRSPTFLLHRTVAINAWSNDASTFMDEFSFRSWNFTVNLQFDVLRHCVFLSKSFSNESRALFWNWVRPEKRISNTCIGMKRQNCFASNGIFFLWNITRQINRREKSGTCAYDCPRCTIINHLTVWIFRARCCLDWKGDNNVQKIQRKAVLSSLI